VSAAGLDHPSKLSAEHIVRRVSGNEVKLLSSLFPFLKRGELLSGVPSYTVYRKYWPMAQAESFEAMLQQTEAA